MALSPEIIIASVRNVIPALWLGLVLAFGLAHPSFAAGGEEKLLSIPMHTIEVVSTQNPKMKRAITMELYLAFGDESGYATYSSQKGTIIAAMDKALSARPYEDYLLGNAARVIKETARDAAQAVNPQVAVTEVLIRFLLVQ